MTVAGRIDSSNAKELDAALARSYGRRPLPASSSISAGVTYMSSAGLRTLVSALRDCKKKGGDLRLSTPSERVTEVLDLAGLTSGANPFFTVFGDDTSAVGSF